MTEFPTKSRRFPLAFFDVRVLTQWNSAFLIALWIFEQLFAESYRHTNILTYAPQHGWLLPTTCLLAICLIMRRWKLFVFNALVLLVSCVTFLGFNVPWRTFQAQSNIRVQAPRARKPNLRVMTFNIEGGALGIARVAEVVRAHNPDILCLQETRRAPDAIPALRKALSADYFVARTHEVTTFSRFPIVAKNVIEMPSATGRAVLETRLNVAGKTLTVFNAHISMAALSASDEREENALPRVLQFGGSAQIRRTQIEILLAATRKSTTPFIVCGDFNTPPRGQVYRLLSRELTDSFGVAGWGSGFSFPSENPLMRIDYVWLSSGFRVLDSFVPNVRGSDHRPAITDLEF